MLKRSLVPSAWFCGVALILSACATAPATNSVTTTTTTTVKKTTVSAASGPRQTGTNS
ncbi:MAG: hypothetical protein H0X40_18995 [Chthoniobacterales bacterium]|nr:hypothetical protein [Chthoniobacterales bacterium]